MELLPTNDKHRGLASSILYTAFYLLIVENYYVVIFRLILPFSHFPINKQILKTFS